MVASHFYLPSYILKVSLSFTLSKFSGKNVSINWENVEFFFIAASFCCLAGVVFIDTGDNSLAFKLGFARPLLALVLWLADKIFIKAMFEILFAADVDFVSTRINTAKATNVKNSSAIRNDPKNWNKKNKI